MSWIGTKIAPEEWLACWKPSHADNDDNGLNLNGVNGKEGEAHEKM